MRALAALLAVVLAAVACGAAEPTPERIKAPRDDSALDLRVWNWDEDEDGRQYIEGTVSSELYSFGYVQISFLLFDERGGRRTPARPALARKAIEVPGPNRARLGRGCHEGEAC